MADDKTKKEPSIADVLARLEAVETSNKSLLSENESLRRSTMQLMAAPPIATTQAVTQTTPAKDTLPDPVDDPKGYARAVEEQAERRARSIVDAERTRDQSARSQKERTDQLFADFGRKYPEIAKNKSRLEYVAGEVVKKAIARGMDGQKYVFNASDMFMEDVAKAYKEEFGDAMPADPTDPVTKKDTSTDDDATRTGGIMGGLESGHSPSGKKDDKGPEPVTGMVKELQDIQIKSGFF